MTTRKAQLKARLAELQDRLNSIEQTLEVEPPSDNEDRASEREDDEVLEGLGNSGLLEIQMIEAALGRLDDGSYGDCMKCGEEIAPARLDLLPYTPFCHGCAV
jgi:RNA polymerase-binding transcription factor DksA